MLFLVKGLVIGIGITAPIGPTAILIINRLIKKGTSSGIISALGATTSELFFAVFVVVGMSTIESLWASYEIPIRVVSSVVLFVLAYSLLRKSPTITEAKDLPSDSLMKDYFSTLLVMITNPASYILYTGFVSEFILNEGGTNKYLFLCGVVLGAFIWWMFLSISTLKLKEKFLSKYIAKINIATGILLILFSIYSLIPS